MPAKPANPANIDAAHRLRGGVHPRDFLRYLGPAFLVSVGYIDPGNWATNIAAGSYFKYDLLWVVLVSNIFAIVLQSLSAKLGLASRRNLAEACRETFHPAANTALWLTTEIAMMATDVAEFLGAALGFHILLGISMPIAALLTALSVYGILGLERFGFRKIEYAIIGLVSIVGLGYVLELLIAKPDTNGIVYHLFVPMANAKSILVAVGILGATVMPHNLFLHSELIKSRLDIMKERGWTMRRFIRLSYLDSFIALNASFLINAAMIVMAAAVFFSRGIAVDSIEQAHETLAPLLGGLSSAVFAIALLASGLSSSVTATLAGQIVMSGFMHFRISLWWRRTITIIPALVIIFLGLDTLKILILSQVTLSLQLPFACVPLLMFTSQKRMMGEFQNKPLTIAATAVIIGIILYLNALLVVQMLS